jgi:hypothetical protein
VPWPFTSAPPGLCLGVTMALIPSWLLWAARSTASVCYAGLHDLFNDGFARLSLITMECQPKPSFAHLLVYDGRYPTSHCSGRMGFMCPRTMDLMLLTGLSHPFRNDGSRPPLAGCGVSVSSCSLGSASVGCGISTMAAISAHLP